VEQSPDGALLPICGLPCTYRPPIPSSSGGGDGLSGSALFHHQISDDKRWRRGLDFPSSLFISFAAPYAPPPSPPSAPPPPSTRTSVGCGSGAPTRAHAAPRWRSRAQGAMAGGEVGLASGIALLLYPARNSILIFPSSYLALLIIE